MAELRCEGASKMHSFPNDKGTFMFLLFDVGGTKMRMAIADDGGIKGKAVIIPTPTDFEQCLALIVDTAQSLAQGEEITRVVGGLAGALDRAHTMLVAGSNIWPWVGKPVKDMLAKEFNAPVHLENDAALAGLGEATVGAGKDYPIVGYITVSTGVGGARITNKTIDAHVFGFEPGYQIVDADGSLCTRCAKRNLEAHISGRGIEDHYGKKPEDIHDKNVWEGVASALAVGLTNTIVHWSPDIMVLGGSVMKAISIERVREVVGELLHVYPEIPAIERAQLGDIGGLMGALQIARQIG